MRIRRGQAGAQAVGQVVSTASAGSSNGTNTSSATGLCAGSRSKNSSRQVARINVEPLPKSEEASANGSAAKGDKSPTSTTIAIPYRAPEPAEQTLERTPRSRQGSENHIEVPQPQLPESLIDEILLPESVAQSNGVNDYNGDDNKKDNNVDQSPSLAFDSIYPANGDEHFVTAEK